MKRYSETISDELKDTVLSIQARHVTDFKSCAFEILEDMGDELTVCRWIRAQRDESSHNWVVQEYQTAPYLASENVKATDIRNMPTEQRILMHRACFMDALDACASFETLEREKGKMPVGPDIDEIGMKHYKNAGEKEGIPFDLNKGTPVPAANGIILTEKAALPPISEEFEERSKGNMIRKDQVPALSAHDLFGHKLDIPEQQFHGRAGEKALATREKLLSEQKIKRTHEIQTKHIEKLVKAFNKASRYDFKNFDMRLQNPIISSVAGSSVFTFQLLYAPIAAVEGTAGGIAFASLMTILTTMGIGAVSGLGTMIATDTSPAFNKKVRENMPSSPLDYFRQNGVRLPMREFNRQLKNVRKDTSALDDENEKFRLRQLTDKMELATYALRARYSFKKAAEHGGWLNMRRMERDQASLEKKAQQLGMNQNDVKNLLTMIQKSSGLIEQDLTGQFETDIRRIAGSFDSHQNRKLRTLTASSP